MGSDSTTDETNNNKDKLDAACHSADAKDETFGDSDTKESDEDDDTVTGHGLKRKIDVIDEDDGKKQRTEDNTIRIEEKFDALSETLKEHISLLIIRNLEIFSVCLNNLPRNLST